MGFFCIFLSQRFMRFFSLGQDCSNTRNMVRGMVVIGKKNEVRISGLVPFPDLGRGISDGQDRNEFRSNGGNQSVVFSRRRMTVFIHVGVGVLVQNKDGSKIGKRRREIFI